MNQTLKLCFSQKKKNSSKNNIKKHDISLEKIELIESGGVDFKSRTTRS